MFEPPFLPDESGHNYFVMNDLLSCVEKLEIRAVLAIEYVAMTRNLDEAIADKLFQARPGTSQRPNHTRHGVCKTQAENVLAVCLTEAVSFYMNRRDKSESDL